MRIKKLTIFLVSATCFIFRCSDVQAQMQWGPTAVTSVYSPFQSPACVLFTLAGVSQADPVAPNQPYFAVPKSDPNYQEHFSLVATALANKSSLIAITTGTLACGYAQLFYVVAVPPP